MSSLKEIIASVLFLFISYILKHFFSDALCSINSFGCFVGVIAYKLPIFIILVYWIVKAYPYLEEFLN